MKPRALALVLAASLVLDACGSNATGGSTSTRSQASAGSPVAASTTLAPVETKADADRDNDGPPADDTNNNEVSDYGHEASAADRLAVTRLVKRFYHLAVARDGTSTCSLLSPTLAKAVAGDYGQGSAGPSYLAQGTTCPAVMDLLFAHFHAQLALELPLLKVARVRVQGDSGRVLLVFGSLPERELAVLREGRAWRIDALLDNPLP